MPDRLKLKKVPPLKLRKMPPLQLRKMEPLMIKRAMTKADATALVEKIEALHAQIDELYADARDYLGENNDSVIHDAVAARRRQREAAESAAALLSGFDS